MILQLAKSEPRNLDRRMKYWGPLGPWILFPGFVLFPTTRSSSHSGFS